MENKIENQNNNQSTKKKGLAIASLVFGIIGAGYVSTISLIASIVAIVYGIMAMNKIKKDPNSYAGKGLAIAGLMLGCLGLVIVIVLGVLRGATNNILGL